ncbi:MAG: RloB domain-containing protein [Magnetococcales bacterium]|nr:RloB domain-containing protein [Magnetococcales bacterium]
MVVRQSSPGNERSSNSLERSHPKLSPRDRILIVCSAESACYFQDIVDHLQLGSRITICATHSCDPIEQVEEALAISHQAAPHRRLFALLDQEGSPADSQERSDPISQAKRMARHHDLPNNRIFRLILSAPGFPLWLLLHFDEVEFSALPAVEWPKKVIDKLEAYLPNAQEADTREHYFEKTREFMALAIKRGQKQLLIQSVKAGPKTEIHELIIYLLKLQERHRRLST